MDNNDGNDTLLSLLTWLWLRLCIIQLPVPFTIKKNTPSDGYDYDYEYDYDITNTITSSIHVIFRVTVIVITHLNLDEYYGYASHKYKCHRPWHHGEYVYTQSNGSDNDNCDRISNSKRDVADNN